MPRTWSATRISALAESRPQWFGLPRDRAPVAPAVSHLGDGESYSAWTALVPGAPRERVVVRAARRARVELPAAPEEEFTGLALAPTGLAPEPIDLIDDHVPGGDPDGGGAAYPVIVESLVPGRVLPAAAWTSQARERLAAGLARLHEQTWAAPGPVSSRATNPPGPIRYDDHIAAVAEHWAALLPGADAPFRGVSEAMSAYAAQAAAEIASVDRFALLHGDPVLTNILVDADERITLVDWEWTQIGDPARDLGFLGGAIHADPWYAPLGPEEITDFLRAYLDAGGRGDLAGLRRRRDAWLAAETYGVLGYLLWLDADPGQTALPWHRTGATSLAHTLAAFLRAATGRRQA